MNLIEQLGGYECAAYEYKNTLLADDFPYVIKATGTKFTRPELGDELLEHRRQHNIYEVGDAVVIRESLRYPAPNRLFKVYTKIKVYSDGSDSIYVSGSKGLVQMSTQYIRHATDEEIKAGKRLEVNQ